MKELLRFQWFSFNYLSIIPKYHLKITQIDTIYQVRNEKWIRRYFFPNTFLGIQYIYFCEFLLVEVSLNILFWSETAPLYLF